MKRVMPRLRKKIGVQPVLLRGHLIGQIVLWLATLGYTQLYGADAYGIFALFLGLVNVCGLLACLGYEITLLLPADRVEAEQLLSGCFALVTLSAMLVGGLLCFFRLSEYLSIPIGWLVLAIWGQGILVVQQEWCTRQGDWIGLGILWRTQYMAMAVLQGVCYFVCPDNGLMVGYALALGGLGGQSCWRERHSLRLDRFLMGNLRRYWPLVCLDLGGRSVQLLAQQIQPLLILPCFGPKKAAHFFLAQQLLGKPLQALIAGYRGPFLKRSKKSLHQGNGPAIWAEALRTLQQIAYLILPCWCFVIIVLIGSHFWLSPDWRGVGVVLLFLLPLYLGKACFSPISGLAPLLRKSHWTFCFNGFLLGWSLLSLLAGYTSESFHGFLISYSVGVGLGYVQLQHRFRQFLKRGHVASI